MTRRYGREEPFHPARGHQVLRDGALVLRELRQRDRTDWQRLRQANLEWLTPWEATNPERSVTPVSFSAYVRDLRRRARRDQGYAFVLTWRGQLVGQVTIAGVERGSVQGASIGYWISEHVAGQGLMPRAAALVIDYCFGPLGLHRIEINVRPENAASLRVPQKLGLREEGLRVRYLHIQGRWRDHRCFAITAEEVTGSMLDRLTTA